VRISKQKAFYQIYSLNASTNIICNLRILSTKHEKSAGNVIPAPRFIISESHPDDFASFLPPEFTVDINENNIVADTADTFPWNDKVILSPEKSEKTARTRHNNRQYTACQRVDEHVTDKTHAQAVMYVNDLLAPEIGNPALHSSPSIRLNTS